MRGEVHKVVKWLRKGGAIDALCSTRMNDGRTATASLLHAAAGHGHLELVRELLKRGASVDLPSSLGVTALMAAAYAGRLSILLILLQHSAELDLQQNDHGNTALMLAASRGHEGCVQALLRAIRSCPAQTLPLPLPLPLPNPCPYPYPYPYPYTYTYSTPTHTRPPTPTPCTPTGATRSHAQVGAG